MKGRLLQNLQISFRVCKSRHFLKRNIMKIQYASDLHLELSGNSKYVKEIPFEVSGDILVLAGDKIGRAHV